MRVKVPMMRVLRADGSTELRASSPVREPTQMRRFTLDRLVDETGTSGTGLVAEGVVFTDGTVALRWLTDRTSTAIYDGISDVVLIHGHNGSTQVRWFDA